jgi:hypothetical protein
MIALVPIASTYAGNVPLTMQPVVLPQWFASVTPHLAPGQVIPTHRCSAGSRRRWPGRPSTGCRSL